MAGKAPLGIGVVGTGAIGIRGALEHLTLPDVGGKVRVTAVCDPFPGRAEAAAKKYGVPAWYREYEALLDDPAVDAVTICSPISLHYEQGMMAIKAGKHVHFNKPMAISVKQADDLIRAAARKRVKIVASPGVMLHPVNQRIRRALLEGKIGRPVWAVTGMSISDYHLKEEFRKGGKDPLANIDPSWYFKKPGGGPMWDVVVYALHLLTGILGPAKRVTALSGQVVKFREFAGRKIRCEMDDNTLLLLDFGKSLFAFVYGTLSGSLTPAVPRMRTVVIFGTDGEIRGHELNGKLLRKKTDHQPHVVGVHKEMKESHVFEDIMQLVDWVRDGKPSIVTAAHARHVIEIIEAGYRAAETGKTVDLKTRFTPLPLDRLAV